MSENKLIKNIWEKVLEYASSPLHGTMSRKIRKGVKLKVIGVGRYADFAMGSLTGWSGYHPRPDRNRK